MYLLNRDGAVPKSDKYLKSYFIFTFIPYSNYKFILYDFILILNINDKFDRD